MIKLFSETIVLLLLTSSFTVYSQEKLTQSATDSTATIAQSDTSKVQAEQTAAADSSVKSAPVSQDTTPITQDTISKIDSAAAQPKTTVVQINSTPEGAAVLLKDSVIGITPVTVANVVPGNYSLVLKMKGYYQKKCEITVSLTDTQKISFELLKPAMVTYLSKPDGVAVTANGKNRGTTPFVDSLVKPGNYLIQGTLEDYEVILKNITIDNGAVDTVMLEMKKTGEKEKSPAPVQKQEIRPLKKYSGIIGAAAFAVFSCILLIAERDNL